MLGELDPSTVAYRRGLFIGCTLSPVTRWDRRDLSGVCRHDACTVVDRIGVSPLAGWRPNAGKVDSVAVPDAPSGDSFFGTHDACASLIKPEIVSTTFQKASTQRSHFKREPWPTRLPKVDRRLTAFATLKKRSPQSTWGLLLSAVPATLALRCSPSSGNSVGRVDSKSQQILKIIAVGSSGPIFLALFYPLLALIK